MSKLREKFDQAIDGTGHTIVDKCEQITDDFSVKLLIWIANLKPNDKKLKHIDYNKDDESVAKEIQQIFKEKYYE